MENTQAINVFGFGKTALEPSDELLGGKGAKLAEMSALGLPVPAGVTITTEQCKSYFNIAREDRAQFIASLVDDVLAGFKSMSDHFDYMPLVSVRSGARVSMPGMMDTVLNVGISIANKHQWEERLGKETADDCFRRLITMYSEVVLGIPHEIFEDCTDSESHLQRFTELTDQAFPISLEDQLGPCIEAVFNSWYSDRAVAYRNMHGYSHDWGTAVNVQSMVFGNAGDDSCSGVLFTRDFNTGEPEFIIDWLPNAQGEDVVAGTHNPLNKVAMMEWNQAAHDELHGYASQLEEHYNDMQDIEFTVENGNVYILQTRNGKRAALAAFRIAYDLQKWGKITKEEALNRVSGREYMALKAPKVNPEYDVAADVVGTPASGSIVSGIAVLSAADAVKCKEDCILVAKETTPEDFSGMAASKGIITQTGGITSHAAVVARGMNKTCVVGAENLKFEGLAGKRITVNGKTGDIWIDKDVPVSRGEVPKFVEEMLTWVDTKTTGILAVAPENVSKGGTFYVDVSDRLHTQTLLSKALDCLKGATGIISFGNNTPMQESDATFLSYFGVDAAGTEEGDWMIIEKVLSMGKWNATFKKNWAIHLPNDASVHYANVLRSHGWNVVSRVNSFKAALSTDGYVVLEQSFLDQLDREGMDFSEIEELVTAAGREVKSLPETVSQTQLIFDALGG